MARVVEPKPPAIVDRARRVAFEREVSARLFSADGTWWTECRVIDISASGAQLQVDRTPTATEFFLALSNSVKPPYRRCSKVWLNGDRLGVKFLKPGASRARRDAPSQAT